MRPGCPLCGWQVILKLVHESGREFIFVTKPAGSVYTFQLVRTLPLCSPSSTGGDHMVEEEEEEEGGGDEVHMVQGEGEWWGEGVEWVRRAIIVREREREKK